mmetsp:Transcript_130140/g.229154  ORF Transcript_130140/g.229154 Transcript_130140/m.229154 type:complete len:716 (+) Transcript_130140:2-2149(+)
MNDEPPSEAEQIISFFRKFDTDCNGYIDREELKCVFLKICPSCFDDRKVEKVFKVVDVNNDGRIDYKEFVNWLMNGSPSKRPQRLEDAPALDYRTWLPQRFEVDIAKRYALDKLEIGVGCYGKVFIAKDREFADRTVAVKRVTKTRDCDVNEQFYEEIKIMKALDHPNICKLLGTFEEGRHMFFIMEFCGGGELFARIDQQGHIDEAVSADVVRQVTSALCYAHGRSIAHRDLKPENVVFFTDDPRDTLVKLIDWGLGISFAKGRMQAAVGTSMYAAPEVLSSRNVKSYTSACDLWSLGVLTYVMLSGKPPFFGNEMQRYELAMAEKYVMTGKIWNAVSDDAKDFVRGLMKVDLKDRMPVAAAVQHPWLSKTHHATDVEAVRQVLCNIRRFANESVCSAICITAVARHLNHKGLRDIHQVFRRIDTNGDGVLGLDEVKAGFKDIFGSESDEYRDVEVAFGSMDLDRSGFIDYTEFCAAGLGEQACSQEDAIWAAFKAFDFDNTGRISKEELHAVLQNADVERAWTPWVCEAALKEFIRKIDSDGDGYIQFNEFLNFMRQNWAEKADLDIDVTTSMMLDEAITNSLALSSPLSSGRGAPTADSPADPDCEHCARGNRKRCTVGGWAYELLREVSNMPGPPDTRETPGFSESGPSSSPPQGGNASSAKEGLALPIASKKKETAALLPIKSRNSTESVPTTHRQKAPMLPIASKKNTL